MCEAVPGEEGPEPRTERHLGEKDELQVFGTGVGTTPTLLPLRTHKQHQVTGCARHSATPQLLPLPGTWEPEGHLHGTCRYPTRVIAVLGKLFSVLTAKISLVILQLEVKPVSP